MKLIHTLLCLFREEELKKDKCLARACLHSLEKSTYKTVIIYNQGVLTNEELKEFLKEFNLNCIIIGNGVNVGTVVGRQACFLYIWNNLADTKYISEIHLDMIFTWNWEDQLIDFLDTNDEPMISCGIVDAEGNLLFLNEKVTIDIDNLDELFISLRRDIVVHGFTNPCIHNSAILKETGGYNPHFLRGKQCYEDDSMLLGYYYYYGVRANWYPKVNYNTVVYHAIAGQRMGLSDSVLLNFNGLVKQYGAMGLKHLSMLHKSTWHINFFNEEYKKYIAR
jgi:hypothetical protein